MTLLRERMLLARAKHLSFNDIPYYDGSGTVHNISCNIHFPFYSLPVLYMYVSGGVITAAILVIWVQKDLYAKMGNPTISYQCEFSRMT